LNLVTPISAKIILRRFDRRMAFVLSFPSSIPASPIDPQPRTTDDDEEEYETLNS
jgi:hypothetical protein